VRILLLSNLFPPHVEGGAEILANNVATGLKELGHEVPVLTSFYGLVKARREVGIWRTLHTFPVAHFDKRRPVIQQPNQLYNYYRRYHCPANARELRRVIAETRPDVLYIWEITGIGLTSLMKALSELNIPTVFHLGSYWLIYASTPETGQSRLQARRLKQWLIGSFTVPKTATMIAVSCSVKQQYVEAGFDHERIEVIYNGIDPRFLDLPQAERKRRAGATGVPLQLLYVGRLRVEKGIFVILKALELLVNERGKLDSGEMPIHLHIFGSGDQVYADELQAFLQEKRLVQAVTFHGKIPQDELIAYYDRSDIMLVPSLWQEPFGLVIAEAMARRLPVIASNVGGPAEILTHEEDGLLVKAGDERDLAHAIRLLMENPEKRKQLGEAAHATVRERFTIVQNARRVERHLTRAIQKSHQI
jgi:glycogen synthase